jgi:aminopeptidase N
VSLGYRLGHIRNDGRVFRAIVYNKAAVVLDVLRQIAGDEVFFAGLRRFYEQSRFRKVGTGEFQRAMEAATGRGLQRFFDGWIDGVGIPTLAVTHRVESSTTGTDLVLRVEQTGTRFDVPITVTLRYADRPAVELVVPITEHIVETRVPLTGAFRSLGIERNGSSLAHVVRK